MLSPKLDPVVRELLIAMAAEGNPPLETLAPLEARRFSKEKLKFAGGVPETVGSVKDMHIPGPDAAIPIRVYTPETPGPHPALVYFHGGGWVIGDLDTHHSVCCAIARRAGAVLISVDYRLAPEHRFPAAVVDSYAATQWVASNAAQLGVDPKRIAVGGDSAGGNLAAVVSLRSRDEHGPAIALQILVYPVTDLTSFNTTSHQEFAEEHFLTRAQMEWFRNHYLASLDDATNPWASPLREADLHRLPPAIVITAECDPLCDEGEAYAKRLADAGVRVTCTRYAGMIHPFFMFGGVIPEACDAIQRVADALKEC